MAQDLITIDVDTLPGTICVSGVGTWTPAYIDSHFVELRRKIAAMRELRLPVQVVVDLRDADIQPQGTAERLAINCDNSYRDGERVAIVVGSSLAKMHMRRCASRGNFELFLSYNAALTWLTAYTQHAPERLAS